MTLRFTLRSRALHSNIPSVPDGAVPEMVSAFPAETAISETFALETFTRLYPALYFGLLTMGVSYDRERPATFVPTESDEN